MKNANVNNKNEKRYEINLFKRKSWYNFLYVIIKDCPYQLDKIHFYNEDGIVYTNTKSWFGEYSFNVHLKTTKEIKRKIKVDFSNKLPFVIRSQCDWDTRYDLYLPIEDFDLKVSYEKHGSMIMQKVEFYDEDNQLCDFKTCVKYLRQQLIEIDIKYQKHLENIKSLENMTEMYFLNEITTLKGLLEEYHREQENIANYTVEDYLKEINEN